SVLICIPFAFILFNALLPSTPTLFPYTTLFRSITIPPLRERGNDVLLLANHFLEKFSREFTKPGLELSEDARERLLHYRWPGNEIGKHTSELQSLAYLVCRLLLEKKKKLRHLRL